VRNIFLGGNVDVAGLLTARDVLRAFKGSAIPPMSQIVLPPQMFNDEGLTLDGYTLKQLTGALRRVMGR
jgi:hypothetical protein